MYKSACFWAEILWVALSQTLQVTHIQVFGCLSHLILWCVAFHRCRTGNHPSTCLRRSHFWCSSSIHCWSCSGSGKASFWPHFILIMYIWLYEKWRLVATTLLSIPPSMIYAAGFTVWGSQNKKHENKSVALGHWRPSESVFHLLPSVGPVKKTRREREKMWWKGDLREKKVVGRNSLRFVSFKVNMQQGTPVVHLLGNWDVWLWQHLNLRFVMIKLMCCSSVYNTRTHLCWK